MELKYGEKYQWGGYVGTQLELYRFFYQFFEWWEY